MKTVRLGIKNLRSIGEDHVFIDLNRKINLLIGANNCGKSNVLRALKLLSQKTRPLKQLAETDRHQRKTGLDLEYNFTLKSEEADSSQLQVANEISVDWIWQGMDGTVLRSDFTRKLDFNRFNQVMSSVEGSHFIRQPSDQELEIVSNKIGRASCRERV